MYIMSGIHSPEARFKQQSYAQFDRLCQRGKMAKFWSALTKRGNGQLKSLKTLEQTFKVRLQRNEKVQLVELAKIVGSEGRSHDFDGHFRPLKVHNKERWVNIAMARHHGIALPAVELFRIDDSYYVVDGHHRISVAISVGQRDIDAHVTDLHIPPIVAPMPPAGVSAANGVKQTKTKLLMSQLRRLWDSVTNRFPPFGTLGNDQQLLQGS